MLKKQFSKSLVGKIKKEALRVLRLDYSDKSQEELRQILVQERSSKNLNRVNVYAVIVEAFKRTIGISPYENQIIGAILLDEGFLTELKTGEGKTYTAVFPSIINSFSGKVYNVTVNDYLSKRDYEKTKAVYNYLGVNTSWNKPIHELIEDNLPQEKDGVYESDVVFTSGSEFIFDYLRGDISFPLDTVLIDEVDFVLIDNANSKFSISSDEKKSVSDAYRANYELARALIKPLKGGKLEGRSLGRVNEDKYDVDYVVSHHEKMVHLTLNGMENIEKRLGLSRLEENVSLYKAILETLFVETFLMRNRDYVVKEDKIILINRENGRIMPNSKKDSGTQTAIEVKENVTITELSDLENDMSYQLFFSLFKKMIGMSGTIMEAESEFKSVFNAQCLEAPTNKPSVRIDYPTVYFLTKREKYEYMKRVVRETHSTGQPILIVTESETETYVVKKLLKKEKFKVEILNAVTSEREEAIIKKAGCKNSILISTNMAGRGTDIELDDEVESLGGLLVLSLNKYESNRIDNQVRGRAGRQGQRGACLFLSSLDDSIFNHVDTETYLSLKKIMVNQFYSASTQDMIESRIIGKTQVTLNAIHETLRRAMFEEGKVEFIFKSYLLRIVENFSEVEDGEQLLKLYSQLLTPIIKKVFNELRQNIDYNKYELLSVEFSIERTEKEIIDEILEKLQDKVMELSIEDSKLLTAKLLKYFFKNNWVDFKEALHDNAVISGIYGTVTGESLSKFITMSDEAFLDFQKQWILFSVQMLLNANKEKQLDNCQTQ